MKKDDEKRETKPGGAETSPMLPAQVTPFMKILGESEYDEERFLVIAAQEAKEAEIAKDLTLFHAIKAGAALLCIKNCAPHGEKEEAIFQALGKLGIQKSTAYGFMNIAERAKDQNMLDSKIFKLGITKANQLLALPEPELDELVKTGKVGDLTADDVERMSTRELRDAIRKLRDKETKLEEKIKVGKEQLELKDEAILELKAKHRKPSSLESLLYTAATSLAAALERPAVAESGPERDMVDTAARMAYNNARKAYVKFQAPGKVKHVPPANMAELDEEWGGSEDEPAEESTDARSAKN